MDKRGFLSRGAVAGVAATATVQAPYVIAQPKIRWRMVTTWTPALNVMQGSAQLVANGVSELTAGRFSIDVFPGGQLMPTLACFDEVSKGAVEAFMGASYYWSAKEPATQWYCAMPFGMNPAGMASWLYHGGGLALWEETYAGFNLVPRPGPSTGPQMAGWFRRRIDAMADLKGLKMRIPGLGGKVIEQAGGTVVLTPAGDIFRALERGVIDACEWVGPHDDMRLGLHNTARYYYYPGWHEPGTTLEFVFNRKAYGALPIELRQVLNHVVAAVSVLGSSEYESANAIALERLRSEAKGKVEVLQLPAPVLHDLRRLAGDVVREESQKSPLARKAHASFTSFQSRLGGWRKVSESAYHELVAT